MDELNEIVKIFNRVYIRLIKKLLKKLEKSNLKDSCRNNFIASGELIIDILKLMEKQKINVALPCLRNVYEMTLKAIALEDNQEIKESYDKVIKNVEKDRMSEVRKYIAENFNKYFSMIEKDEIFDNILGEGILTYVYKCLCRYSHATKVNEFVYLVQKDNNLKEYFNCYLVVFLIYQIILLYTDVICTKLKLEKINNEIFMVSAIIMFNLMNILFKSKSKIEDIKKISEKILGQPDELFKIRIDKEKQITLQYAKETDKLIKENGIKKEMLNIFFDYYFKKYFTKKELEKLNILYKEKE